MNRPNDCTYDLLGSSNMNDQISTNHMTNLYRNHNQTPLIQADPPIDKTSLKWSVFITLKSNVKYSKKFQFLLICLGQMSNI